MTDRELIKLYKRADKKLLRVICDGIKEANDPPFFTGQTISSPRVVSNRYVSINPLNYDYLDKTSYEGFEIFKGRSREDIDKYGFNTKSKKNIGSYFNYKRIPYRINKKTGEVYLKGDKLPRGRHTQIVYATSFYKDLRWSYAAKVNFITGGWSRRHKHWIEEAIKKNEVYIKSAMLNWIHHGV